MSSSNYICNYPMTDDKYQKDFNLHYSYDKDPDYENRYFKITSDNPAGLQISIYKDDLSFLKGSKTEPRSEIRSLLVIKDNIQYTLSWDQYIQNYLPSYWFSFFQLFAKDGPNVILRWKNNNYELLALNGKNKSVPIKLNITDDIDKWSNWKIAFNLSVVKGYIRVYRNNILIAEIADANTSGGDDSYLKLGIYSQDMLPINDMNITIKNLQLY